MATTCPQCGSTALSGASFCATCGATLGTRSSVVLPAPPAQQSVPGSQRSERSQSSQGAQRQTGPTRKATDTRALIFAAAALVVAFVFSALGYRWMIDPPRPVVPTVSEAPAPEPVAPSGPPPETESLVQLAEEAETLARNQVQMTRDMQTAIARYQKRSGGALPGSIGAELTEEQRALLTERIRSEKMGTASLLQDLLAKDKQLQELKSRLDEVNGRLPDSVIAADGQRHERIAMEYLANKGLKTDEAYRLVSQAALTEPLFPGFRVFFLYQNGQFGTWVTQGTARRSPKSVREELVRMANEERDAALSALEATKADRDDLRNLANATEKSLRDAEADLKAMQAATERQQALNSTLRYVIGSKSQLVKAKVIDGSYRLLSAEGQGNDLLANGPSTLPPIDPSIHGLKRIKRVRVVPGLLTEGEDYTVTLTDGFLSFAIARPERFTQFAKYFVVVLE